MAVVCLEVNTLDHNEKMLVIHRLKGRLIKEIRCRCIVWVDTPLPVEKVRKVVGVVEAVEVRPEDKKLTWPTT